MGGSHRKLSQTELTIWKDPALDMAGEGWGRKVQFGPKTRHCHIQLAPFFCHTYRRICDVIKCDNGGEQKGKNRTTVITINKL